MFDELGTKRKRSKVGKTMAKLYSYSFDHGKMSDEDAHHAAYGDQPDMSAEEASEWLEAFKEARGFC